MKIRAIGLRNVRRFAGKSARIEGIGDGITTICEPNESGKSTFFDALHAAFFIDHKSSAAEVKSLQPYAKGAVEVSVDVETQEGLFRIDKRFLSSKSASVSEIASGRIVAQEGEAEAWITRLLGSDGPGPSGLLWVRQGMSGFGPEGSGPSEKKERDRLREARRTLMSTVAGQIDAVTSGRKMDAITRRCEVEIDKLANKNGSAKAGGPWHAAAREAEALRSEYHRLKAQVDELSEALAERRKLKAELARRSDQEAEARREEDIRKAEAALAQAREHEALIRAAERDLKLALIEAQRDAEARDARHREVARRADLARVLKAAEAAAAEAREATRIAADAVAEAQDALDAARTALRGSRDALRKARAREDRVRLMRRKAELDNLIERIEKQEQERASARKARSAIHIDPDTLGQIEDLERRRSAAAAARAAGAAAYRLRYDGDLRAQSPEGDIQPDSWAPVLEPVVITLPGLGQMELAPAAGASAGDDPADLAREIAGRLEDCGFADLPAAREGLRAKGDAERRERLAESSLEALAPDGAEVLREELRDLEEMIGNLEADEPEADGDPVGLADLEAAVAGAELAESTAREALDVARELHQAAARDGASCETAAQLAGKAVREAEALPLEQVDEAVEAERIATREAAAQTLQDTLAGLHAAAPDIEALEAERERLMSARDGSAMERRRLSDRISELNGQIGVQAESNVEARLAEAAGALEVAEEREQRYAREVEALKLLLAELDGARKAARDAYFGPVYEQLKPLLAMLHEGAEIEMDGETMLPSRIVRDGVAEEIENLSGGASEQVAILTRLAFARLYAQSGRAVPVILDDALVFSDDERIVRMFTALTRIARDQQIIVFSCRQRAFEELGGHRPRIETLAS